MSQVYSTEPQTAGRVVFETTHGPLDIQLWSRECPYTTKFFLQLCLDGYYDQVVFHRVVPNFLIQTGALRQNQKQSVAALPQGKDLQTYRQRVQADEAVQRRNYELNSRIRFNHRGQVAMALGINDEDDLPVLQPQFFITLDEASNLDGKHVCFGTVTGPTMFNALRIGQTDVDESTNQPTIMEEAPRVERVKILENPIHADIVPSPLLPWRVPEKEAPKKLKRKRKGVKNINVLSFGDEMEEETTSAGGGMKSSHDVISSKKLSKEVDQGLKAAIAKAGSKPAPPMKRDEKPDSPAVSAPKAPPPMPDEKREAKPSIVPTAKIVREGQANTTSIGLAGRAEEAKPKMSLVEARRAKYAKKSKDKRKREEDTLTKLKAFQSKVVNRKPTSAHTDDEDNALAARMSKQSDSKDEGQQPEQTAETYHGQILDMDDGGSDWMRTRFKCRKHMDQDARLGGDGRSMDDYEVIDDNRHDGPKRKHRKRHDHQRNNSRNN